jgi:hypothetical protein
MNYQHALDCIFESFIAAKPHLVGKFDRDVRNPNLLLDIARSYDLLPDRKRVIKVTGSKGKGTVVRLIAQSLQDHRDVGLIVSPEEITHLDRIRINGQSISEAEFIQCFNEVWQMTHPLRENLIAPNYLSPYGLFLLIGFVWFKSKNVDAFVIETGRGVKYDEGGQIPAKVAVLTSVFLEHASYLGPSLEEITTDKRSIAEGCDFFIEGEKGCAGLERPAWFAKCQQTAKRAVEAFLERSIKLPDGECASFGQSIDKQGRRWFFEGMIAKESADVDFLKQLVTQHEGQVLFLISLPDDKDVEGVCAIIDNLGADSKHIIMTGERGFLSYEMARHKTLAYEGPYDDPMSLRNALDVGKAQVIYFIGTQTYLRLVKQAFFI